ncbi:MAG: DUF5722 domain-containing protein [Verrucomicrobiae bacterium]|nr:DUF5722 domain-containing protein [Verrucomicrobiae bacterium]
MAAGGNAMEFPQAASKKGLQVQMVEDALALGVKHAAININLTALVDLRRQPDNPQWNHGGQTYHFHKGYLESLDRQIKPLSDHGVVVYLIVLSYASGRPEVDKLALHPNYVTNAPNRLGAFNTVTPEGRQWYSACMEYLAHRWSGTNQAHGRVAGYIIGNEVTSHWWWCNMGRVSLEKFTDYYEDTVRLFHQAIRRQAGWPRVYLSLDHHWSIRYSAGDEQQAFGGRPFLEAFARRARQRGDFDWHVAYHPYPENLFEPRFWLDKTALPRPDTPRITFKNLDVLTDFLQQPALLYRGQRRRVILSEQGFHTPKGEEGELLQAAAYCYAYKIVEQLEGIDAFILHRHVDHAHEGGLLLGLWSHRPGSVADPYEKKRIYECFRLADTPQWREAFDFALPLIGLKSWDALPRRP